MPNKQHRDRTSNPQTTAEGERSEQLGGIQISLTNDNSCNNWSSERTIISVIVWVLSWYWKYEGEENEWLIKREHGCRGIKYEELRRKFEEQVFKTITELCCELQKKIAPQVDKPRTYGRRGGWRRRPERQQRTHVDRWLQMEHPSDSPSTLWAGKSLFGETVPPNHGTSRAKIELTRTRERVQASKRLTRRVEGKHYWR